jgi:GDP-L-fucose synthase
MQEYSEEQFINVGSGVEVSIRELTELVRSVVDFQGDILWDPTKPDGSPRKLMDSSRLFALGWRPEIGLRQGIELAYQDYCSRWGATI